MAEYIEREDAINAISIVHGELIEIGEVVDILDEIPAADVHPVKHGRWILDNPQYLLSHCSECRCFNSIGYKWKYCPNCGARMDGEDNG